MYRTAIFVIMLSLATTAGFAQLQPTPRVTREVADPSMVIDDRGSKLEVLPTVRAAERLSTSGKHVVHSIFPASVSDPIRPPQLGIVFNHAMQVQGYITGEIAFRMKDGLQAIEWLDAASYPGLAKLTNPNIYLVAARTPAEFIELVKRLQGRSDMEWVEPMVTYGDLKPVTDAR